MAGAAQQPAGGGQEEQGQQRKRWRWFLLALGVVAVVVAVVVPVVLTTTKGAGGKKAKENVEAKAQSSGSVSSSSGTSGGNKQMDMNMDMGGQHNMDMGGSSSGAGGGSGSSGGMNMNMEAIETCTAGNGEDLQMVVEMSDCPVIHLSAQNYMLMSQITVSRYVSIVGNPALLPLIDASMTIRAFRVVAGGFLELKYVKVRQGMGVIKSRLSIPGTERRKKRKLQPMGDMPGMGDGGGGMSDMMTAVNSIMEIRGGSVAVEVGALGASFIGVLFLYLADSPEAVTMAITQTVNFVGMRMYGGHVFVAAGVVTFFNSHFYDSVILMPLNDQVMIGGDVLVVAGEAFFTMSSFTMTTLFGAMAGVGFQVAVLGGTAVFNFVTVQAQGVAQNTAGAGIVFFVGGGVMVLTGVDFRMVAAVMGFEGIGNFFVGAGVLVETGMTIENAWGAMAMLGAGYYQAVGAGVHVQSGVTYVQAMGPNYMALTGGSIFVGTGTSINTGVSSAFASSVGAYQGQGQFWYNGAGYSHFIGCPISMAMATVSFNGLGGIYSQPAGHVVFIGNPIFMATGLQYFSGLGAVMFVGAGSAVLGYSPVYMPSGPIYMMPEMGAAYWINGNDMASSCGSPVYVDATGSYGRDPIYKQEDPLLAYVRSIMWTDDMDPPPYGNCSQFFYPANATAANNNFTDDFPDYLDPEFPTNDTSNSTTGHMGRVRTLHVTTPGGSGSTMVMHSDNMFLDPLEAFAEYRLMFGDTSYVDDIPWDPAFDRGGVIEDIFGDGSDFFDYKMLGMVMDCDMIDGMSMDHMSLVMNGIVMDGVPLWMSNAHMAGHSSMGMRRRAVLGGGGVGGTWDAAQFFDDVVGEDDTSKVVARNLQVLKYTADLYKDNSTVQSIKAWADPRIVDAGLAMQKAFLSLPATASTSGESTRRTTAATPSAPAKTLYFKDPNNLNCLTCNVDDVAGPGAASCLSEDQCSSLPQNKMFDWQGLEFKPTVLSLWDVYITGSKSSSLSSRALQDVVKEQLSSHLPEGAQVTVFDTKTGIATIDNFVAPQDDEASNGALTERSLRAVVIGDNEDSMAKVTSLFQDQAFKSKFTQNVTEALSDRLSVEEAGLSLNKGIKVPAYSGGDSLKTAFKDQISAAAGSNSIRVVEKEGNTIMVTTVTRDKDYNILLKNFSPGTVLDTYLVGSTSAVQAAAYTLTTNVTTDDTGAATLTWNVSSNVAAGKYFIKAADITSGDTIGTSAVFDIGNANRRRKLFGPLLRL